MRICSLSRCNPLKLEGVLGESYFVNAKEKLARLLNKKKENDVKYESLQLKVK